MKSDLGTGKEGRKEHGAPFSCLFTYIFFLLQQCVWMKFGTKKEGRIYVNVNLPGRRSHPLSHLSCPEMLSTTFSNF